MNDHDALLRAIGENPQEDTPRLVYADWLEENDEPERADFVRNQVELARIGLNAPDRAPLVRKNLRYLMDYVPYWKSQLPRLEGVSWGDFNRGLIEEVQGTSEAPIVKYASEIFAVPGIHILRLARFKHARWLARLPELARLRGLKMVSAGAEAPALQQLLRSDYLGRLTYMDLHGNRADDAVATDIADGRFPDLEELWLGDNAIGEAGGQALADSPHLTHLRFLDLRGNRVVPPRIVFALLKRFGSNVKT